MIKIGSKFSAKNSNGDSIYTITNILSADKVQYSEGTFIYVDDYIRIENSPGLIWANWLPSLHHKSWDTYIIVQAAAGLGMNVSNTTPPPVAPIVKPAYPYACNSTGNFAVGGTFIWEDTATHAYIQFEIKTNLGSGKVEIIESATGKVFISSLDDIEADIHTWSLSWRSTRPLQRNLNFTNMIKYTRAGSAAFNSNGGKAIVTIPPSYIPQAQVNASMQQAINQIAQQMQINTTHLSNHQINSINGCPVCHSEVEDRVFNTFSFKFCPKCRKEV